MAPKQKWAVNLAQALQKWCDEHGYKPRSGFGRELKIPQTQWQHIISGSMISGDPAIYARIFVKTGLSEANPCRIPPRNVKLPRGGSAEVIRAWNNDQLQEWLQKNQQEVPGPERGQVTEKGVQAAVSSARKAETRTAIPQATKPAEERPRISTGGLMGRFIDSLVDSIGEQIGRRAASIIVEEVKSQLLPELHAVLNRQPRQEAAIAASSKGSQDIEMLAKKLVRELQRAAEATPAEQEKIYRKHGGDLIDLASLLDIFTTSDPQARERRIKEGRELKEVRL